MVKFTDPPFCFLKLIVRKILCCNQVIELSLRLWVKITEERHETAEAALEVPRLFVYISVDRVFD